MPNLASEQNCDKNIEQNGQNAEQITLLDANIYVAKGQCKGRHLTVWWEMPIMFPCAPPPPPLTVIANVPNDSNAMNTI